MPTRDALGRHLGSLRLSVTDRCNIRCSYCMPEHEYAWLPRAHLLTFEEMVCLVDVFASLGVRRVRLTGGEPLLRRDLPALVRLIAARPAIGDLALTTNGLLLAAEARALRDAGLHRVTVSLDTLRRERFKTLTRFDGLDQVLAGVVAARDVFGSLKIDSVILRGVNDDELSDLVEFGRRMQAEVRFIEYMDVGGATRWSPQAVVTRREMLEAIVARYGPVEPIVEESTAPADRYRLRDGTVFGIISSTTQPFCRACDRSRLTADGLWLLCLYATDGIDLRTPLRAGATNAELAAIVERRWASRDDRGAEARLALVDRSAFASPVELRARAHLEMHKRGG